MKINIIISLVVSFIVSITMMYVAWEHNSQNEIYSDSKIDLSYLLLIGFSWLIVSFVVFILVMLIVKVLKKFKN